MLGGASIHSWCLGAQHTFSRRPKRFHFYVASHPCSHRDNSVSRRGLKRGRLAEMILRALAHERIAAAALAAQIAAVVGVGFGIAACACTLRGSSSRYVIREPRRGGRSEGSRRRRSVIDASYEGYVIAHWRRTLRLGYRLGIAICAYALFAPWREG